MRTELYFKDKIAIVTGGGSGIGRALCQALAHLGATVICTDVNLKSAEETTSLIKEGNLLAEQLDVTQQEEVEQTVERVTKKYGRLDFMFNNAGIAVGGEIRDLEAGHWHKVMDVNFFGVLYGSMAAYKIMARQGFGHIINTASMLGLLFLSPISAPYGVSKHAVVSFTRNLRLEGEDLGVQVSVVCPGFVKTNIAFAGLAVNAKERSGNWLFNQIVKGLEPQRAAKKILKGASKNREVIVFPSGIFYALFLNKFFKTGIKVFFRRLLRNFRKKERIND